MGKGKTINSLFIGVRDMRVGPNEADVLRSLVALDLGRFTPTASGDHLKDEGCLTVVHTGIPSAGARVTKNHMWCLVKGVANGGYRVTSTDAVTYTTLPDPAEREICKPGTSTRTTVAYRSLTEVGLQKLVPEVTLAFAHLGMYK